DAAAYVPDSATRVRRASRARRRPRGRRAESSRARLMRFPRKAMILAAGLGTRLRPLTETTPKALLEIGGRPMIEYPLRMLAAAGVEEIVVNLHHLGEQIRVMLGDGDRYGVRIHYSPEEPVLDTGGALVRAKALL